MNKKKNKLQALKLNTTKGIPCIEILNEAAFENKYIENEYIKTGDIFRATTTQMDGILGYVFELILVDVNCKIKDIFTIMPNAKFVKFHNIGND